MSPPARQVALLALGSLAVIGGARQVLAPNAVHSALWLVVTMLNLGFFYVVNSAPFLGFVQIIVYTGAIMMLILFVLMLVGRDASDSLIETLRGQRVAAIVLGSGSPAWSVPDWPGRSATPRRRAWTRPTERQRAGPRLTAVHQVRLRVRGHLGAADHGGGRRDGPGPRGAGQGDQVDQVTRMKERFLPGNYPGAEGRARRLREHHVGGRAGPPAGRQRGRAQHLADPAGPRVDAGEVAPKGTEK